MLPEILQNFMFATQPVFSSLRLLCFDGHATLPSGMTASLWSGIVTEPESSPFKVLGGEPFGLTISPLLVMWHFSTGAKGTLIAPRIRTASPVPSLAFMLLH